MRERGIGPVYTRKSDLCKNFDYSNDGYRSTSQLGVDPLVTETSYKELQCR